MFGAISLGLIGKLVSREMENEKKLKKSVTSLLIDLVFLCLSVYGFYQRILREIISEIIAENDIVTIIVAFTVLFVVYFGMLGILSFFRPVFQKYFRYSITALCLYVFVAFSVIVYIKSHVEASEIRQLGLKVFSIYSWFLVAFFPFELGNIARKIKAYGDYRKKQSAGV